MLRFVDGWARRTHERGITNARAASTEASRRLVEAADVADFLDKRYAAKGLGSHVSEIGNRASRAPKC
jgi:hypothetical protein